MEEKISVFFLGQYSGGRDLRAASSGIAEIVFVLSHYTIMP